MDGIISGTGAVLLASVAAPLLVGIGYGIARYFNKSCGRDFVELINEMTDGYYQTSLDGQLILANPAFSRLMGYENQEQLIAGASAEVVNWYVDPNRRQEFARELNEKGRVEKFRSQIYCERGKKTLWVSESARLVSDSYGRPSHYEGTVREISDTMRHIELENSYRKYTENVPGVMIQARWACDGTFTLPYYGESFFDLVGNLSSHNLMEDARCLLKLVHPDDLPAFVESSENSVANQTEWNLEFRFNRPDGRQIWVSLKATPEIEDDGSCLWHGFLMDITNRKKAERRIHDLAFYDSLTQLPNRRMLLDKLGNSLRNCRAFNKSGALIFLDIDNFKTLNDTRGHGQGDQFLQEMARRLNNCIDEGDAVARFGGDEFVLLLNDLGHDPELAQETAHRVANLILKTVATPVELEDFSFHTTCSLGIEMFNHKNTLPHEILRRADAAMYVSKEEGRNCATFYCSDRQLKRDRSVGLMSDLRDAINTEQLQLHYQMQVDQKGKIVGAEALLRWNHPRQGYISPSQFVPQAEESGLIIPITEWILVEAFRTLRSWRSDVALSDIKLSINISARQFQEPGFVDEVKTLVEEYQVDPSRLVLEMTEHVLSNDTNTVRSVMMDLKDVGVCFSLDDFGTGYSSLVHMRELPFDEVKIDGKFVSDLESNQNDRAITRSIIAMAKALELETVAEWVETDQQRRYLIEKGCSRMQGYLFAPAMPIEDFERAANKAFFDDVKSGRSEKMSESAVA